MKAFHAILAMSVAFAGATVVSAITSRDTGAGREQPRVPVLAELFTSEGCSSCPPADDLLRQLLRAQPVAGVEVIAISEHVDYWNRLGWRDPFSSSQFSDRQSEYARAFGDGQIYTPQLVTDGSAGVVGNDAAAVGQALTRAAKAPRARLSISSQRVEPGKVEVAVTVADLPPTVAHGATFEVVVALVEDGLETAVTRGENARKHLHHDAVARVLGPIGSLLPGRTGGEFRKTILLTGFADLSNTRIVAFLQDRQSRRVAGVATARVP